MITTDYRRRRGAELAFEKLTLRVSAFPCDPALNMITTDYRRRRGAELAFLENLAHGVALRASVSPCLCVSV
jgi:hypothetical protein